MIDVDVSYLRERLRYDPETGKLWWLPHPAMPNFWNTRYAGTEAFTSVTRQGYRHGGIDSRLYLAHRVAWALHYGAWPVDEIDHEDHDRANNRISNLCVSGKVGNSRNRSLSSRNTSGVTGVYWDNRDRYWVAQINVGKRNYRLGTFNSFDAAVAARKRAEQEHGFHSNHGKARA